jgi:hypothetical protein
MANTINGANLAEIAQESLAGLSSLFAPLTFPPAFKAQVKASQLAIQFSQ